VAGEPVTFAATVTIDAGESRGWRRAAPAQVPALDSGTLTITDGDVELAAIDLIDGKASFTTSALTPGTHTITATYSGTATAAPSSTTITQRVDPAAPTVLPATR
jgi:hypothetical protein